MPTDSNGPIIKDKMFTLQETANVLNLHRQTVANLHRKGEINGAKIGKRIRFRQQDIDEYLEKQFAKEEN